MNLERKQIERQFDRAAATYDSVASLQRQMASRLLNNLPHNLTGPLVDLGCGTGDSLKRLTSHLSESMLTGVDLSYAMLVEANKKVPGANLVKADLMSLPFLKNSFKWIFCNAAIQWCNSIAAFQEMRRILCPDGQALVSTFGPKTMQEWRDVLRSTNSQTDRVHSFKSIDQLVNELSRSGFTDVCHSSETVVLTFDSVRQMFDSVRKLGATNARRDRSNGLSGKRWLNRVTQEFEKRRDLDGKLPLSYECCFLFAR